MMVRHRFHEPSNQYQKNTQCDNKRGELKDELLEITRRIELNKNTICRKHPISLWKEKEVKENPKFLKIQCSSYTHHPDKYEQ